MIITYSRQNVVVESCSLNANDNVLLSEKFLSDEKFSKKDFSNKAWH